MKKYISLFLIICIMTCSINVHSVFASSSVTSQQDIVRVSDTIIQGYENLLKYAGILVDTGIINTRSTLQFVKEQLVKLGFFQTTPTDQEVQDFFDDNITVSPHSDSHHNSDITYDQNVNTYIKNEINEIIQNSGYRYVYSLNFYPYYSHFMTPVQYNKLKNLVEANSNYLCCFAPNSNYCVFFENVSDLGFWHNAQYDNDLETCHCNKYSNWASLNFSEGITYSYNGQTEEWVQQNPLNGINQVYTFCFQSDAVTQAFNNRFPYWFVVSGSRIKTYIEYSDFATFQASTVGMQPYYITDSYNNFNNTTGSYNTTTTDNSVTYSDVGNIVNNYYNDNGKYPTPDEIKIQIEIIQSGGGSGGGDSGGGSGGSGDGSSIWDFLSRLGEVLGGLIKNLGNMLTSLIDSIVTIINDVIGKIPQVFNGLLEVVFGGLPEDMKAIIILGVTVMVVYGIIKVIRG